MIESLLNEPYWVIDFLPDRVPEKSAGQYFAVEKYCLRRPMMEDLHHRFIRILLKLNCYDDFSVFAPGEDQAVLNPSPESLVSRIMEKQENLCILLPEEQALITLNQEDLYMTVYHPSEILRSRIARLASSEGLFFWQPNA